MDTFNELKKAWLIVHETSCDEWGEVRAAPGVRLNQEQVTCVCLKLERSFVKGGGR